MQERLGLSDLAILTLKDDVKSLPRLLTAKHIGRLVRWEQTFQMLYRSSEGNYVAKILMALPQVKTVDRNIIHEVFNQALHRPESTPRLIKRSKSSVCAVIFYEGSKDVTVYMTASNEKSSKLVEGLKFSISGAKIISFEKISMASSEGNEKARIRCSNSKQEELVRRGISGLMPLAKEEISYSTGTVAIYPPMQALRVSLAPAITGREFKGIMVNLLMEISKIHASGYTLFTHKEEAERSYLLMGFRLGLILDKKNKVTKAHFSSFEHLRAKSEYENLEAFKALVREEERKLVKFILYLVDKSEGGLSLKEIGLTALQIASLKEYAFSKRDDDCLMSLSDLVSQIASSAVPAS